MFRLCPPPPVEASERDLEESSSEHDTCTENSFKLKVGLKQMTLQLAYVYVSKNTCWLSLLSNHWSTCRKGQNCTPLYEFLMALA